MFYTTINEGIVDKILNKNIKCILSDDELYEIIKSSLNIAKLGIKNANSKVNKFKKFFKFIDNNDSYGKENFDKEFNYLREGIDGVIGEMRLDEAMGIDDYYVWIDNMSDNEYKKYLKYNLFIRSIFNKSILNEYNNYKDKEIIKKFSFNLYYSIDEQEELYEISIHIPKEYYKK